MKIKRKIIKGNDKSEIDKKVESFLAANKNFLYNGVRYIDNGVNIKGFLFYKITK